MRDILEQRISAWLDDAESDVEYAELVEGRWAVRMRQQTRDATTVWFDVGQRSLSYEAYVLPVPEGSTGVYHEALTRNARGWRAYFALDSEGGLVLRGRLAAEAVTMAELDLVLGEIYDMVEMSFRSLVHRAFSIRENSI